MCSDGLVFDVQRNSCYLPQGIDCSQREERQPAQPTLYCPHKYGFFPHVDCSKFLLCKAGAAYLISCPEGEIFDEHKIFNGKVDHHVLTQIKVKGK